MKDISVTLSKQACINWSSQKQGRKGFLSNRKITIKRKEFVNPPGTTTRGPCPPSLGAACAVPSAQDTLRLIRPTTSIPKSCEPQITRRCDEVSHQRECTPSLRYRPGKKKLALLATKLHSTNNKIFTASIQGLHRSGRRKCAAGSRRAAPQGRPETAEPPSKRVSSRSTSEKEASQSL